MAEDIHVAQTADASGLAHLPMRDEDGEIRPQFVEEISRAIHAADTASLRAVVTELHEADLGDLIAALAPEDRVSLVELTGADFDFSALNEVDDTVREEILEELEPQTVADVDKSAVAMGGGSTSSRRAPSPKATVQWSA